MRRPVLQTSIGCDGFAQDQQTGKLALLGIFDRFLQPGIPVPQFVIVDRWTYGEGTFAELVKITDGEGSVVVESQPSEFTLAHPAASHTVVSGFVGVTFPEARVYWVEVMLDGDLELAWPLPVGSLPTTTESEQADPGREPRQGDSDAT
jgi:hypothetical protein